MSGDFSVTVINSKDPWPLRPWIILGSRGRWLWQQLEIGHRFGSMTSRSTQTIITSVTSTNNNNVFTFKLLTNVCQLIFQKSLGVLVQQLHGKVDVLQLSTGNLQISWNGGTNSKYNGIIFSLQFFNSNILTNSGIANKFNAFCSQQIGPPLDYSLVQLHVGNTIHQQPTWPIASLVNSNRVSSFIQLVCTSQSSWTRADNSNASFGSMIGRCWLNPTFLETMVNNCTLNRLDIDWILIYTQNTSSLTWCRTDSTSKFREIVGHQQSLQRIPPFIVKHQLVPFWNNIGNRTSRIRSTEWNTTIHTSSCFVMQLILCQSRSHLFPIFCPFLGISVFLIPTLILHKTSHFVQFSWRLLLQIIVKDCILNISNFWFLFITVSAMNMTMLDLVGFTIGDIGFGILFD
ncbi:conserved hypothetical protein [Lodderomyces elongisporus NRRL YB-4239]|uniref:Uncharacterized protein n=1 Tax=Lodderomyces elongisporus (strain ATCC 11503 / CBS 2605 / JCM 1781 / NBRC 1676 / NRRL YB-4239) TaxID=379508 RepID=A5DT72_LODEL|nr:conserved hypothetical protein [Lodderomyces elongisporus NRRL YB-4239]